MKISVKVDYRAKRREAYPPIGEQLDALWKALAANPSSLTPEASAMLAQIQAVKTQFPKPPGAQS